MHSGLATDVWLGAATIELKRLETYVCERMSDACWLARILLFVASVFTTLGDYCFSDFAKRAGSASYTFAASESLRTASPSCGEAPCVVAKPTAARWQKQLVGRAADREDRYAPAAEQESTTHAARPLCEQFY